MAISARLEAKLRFSRLGPWLLGIDQKSAAYALPPGKIRDGQNLLLDETPGLAQKRNGSRQISTLPSGLPARDGHVFIKIDGSIFLLASDGVSLYSTSDPSVQSAWTLRRTGLDTDGFLEFETAEDKAWMSNGIDPIMSWDGTILFVYDREKTVTIDNVAITATTVRNAQLTEADDFWNGQKLVFTTGANTGTVVTVTDFDAATDTITFAPTLSGATAVTDRFKVGLIIPKGRAVRFWDGHLWVGGTTDNPSELRFHQLTDPNTGADIGIDHPLAWPSRNQLDVYSSDGDRLWGISPILRDRIMPHKATGVFRIERDPLTLYRIESVDRSVGSRFPRSWQEKKGLLYFFGQDKDGLPEIYKTDAVSVVPVDPAHGIDPTLRSLRQPNFLFRSLSFSAKPDFDAGILSTFLETTDARLRPQVFDTAVDWQGPGLQAGLNIDIETNPGKAVVLGKPVWEVRYEADAPPESSSPSWQASASGQVTASNAAGILTITAGPATGGFRQYSRTDDPESTKDTFLTVRARKSYFFGIANGNKGVVVTSATNAPTVIRVIGESSNDITVSSDVNDFRTFHLLLKANGTFKLWVDGVLVHSGNAGSTSSTFVKFGLGFPISINDLVQLGPGTVSEFDFVHYHSDFKGDSLSSFGGKVSPTALPNILPTSGEITLQQDYTRVPDALRRVFHSSTLLGGSVGISSWTADSSDFTTGVDAAGFMSVSNGSIPTSLVKRYQRLKLALASPDLHQGPSVDSFVTGALWLTQPIFIGSSITSWREFLATITQPAGSDLTIKIRRFTGLTTPAEVDWAAFVSIASGNNIGTILADGSPPTTRWAQLKIELGPASDGQLPDLDAALLQWVEGDASILPLASVVHKGRHMTACAIGSSAANDLVIVSDRNEAWMKYSGMKLNFMIHFKGALIGFSSENSGILELDVSGFFRDLTAAIDAFLDTREETFGHEELRKDLRYGYVHVGSIQATLDTYLKRQTDTAFGNLRTITLDGLGSDIRANHPAATVAKRFQRRYRNSVLDQDMALRGETIYYNIRGPQP